jgi:hypothetical protein
MTEVVEQEANPALEMIRNLKKNKNIDSDSLNVTKMLDDSILENISFNEVDYAVMLINTHIRLATKELAQSVRFSSKMLTDLRDIVLEDQTGSSQKIISEFFIKYPDTNCDAIKQKLDFYAHVKSREDVNHFLKLLNNRIKKCVIEYALKDYFDKKDLDKFIDNVDKLTDDVHNSIIPFVNLLSLTPEKVKDNIDDRFKLLSSVKAVNAASNYKALLKGQLVIVAAPPGVGKTQYLMNETWYHAKNGYKVSYLALGDALESDFIIKIGCIHFDVTIDEFVDNMSKYMNDPDFNKLRSNIILSVMPSGEILSSDVKRYYKNDPTLSTCDVHIFDYDSNFKDLLMFDMYVAHDKIYNNLYALAKDDDNPKLVYVASQVKTQFYAKKLIPMHALAESNRKQAIADYVVTFSGMRYNELNCGYINLAKIRRGRLSYSPIKLSNSGRIIEIPKQEYESISNNIKASSDSYNGDDS